MKVFTLEKYSSIEKIDYHSLENINGIAYRKNNKSIFNLPERIVPPENMDTDL